MKKTLLLFLSLALLLTMGAFVVKAVTQEAFTTNSFNFSGANLNNYVQDDVYKYICKSNECIQVKQATIKPSDGDYFNTKNDCLKKCNANPASVSTGGSATGGLNFNLNSAFTSPSSKPAVGSVSTGGSSLQGLSFADPSAKPFGGTASGTAGSIAKPSTNFGGLSFNTPTAKPSGGSIPGVAGGVTPNSLFGTGLQYSGSSATPQGGTTIPKNEATFFGSLLQKFGLTGAKTDEAIKPQGGKDNPTDKFEFYAEKNEISSGESTNLIWNSSEKGYIHCMFKTAYAGADLKKNIKLEPNGILPVVFNYDKKSDKSDDFKNFKIALHCYKNDTESDPVSETIKVNAKISDDQTTPGKITFTNTTPTKWDATKLSTSTLEWDAKDFKTCLTSAINNVDGWPPKVLGTNGKADVTFKTTGDYKFTITCTPEKGDKVSQDLFVTILKDGEKPPEPGKELSQEAKRKINNNCSFEFAKPGLTSDNGVINKDTKEIKSRVLFVCKDKIIEDKGKDTVLGYDAKPVEYGMYIDIANNSDHGKVMLDCETAKKVKNGTIVKENNTEFEDLTCTLTDSLKTQIAYAVTNNQIIRATSYIDYKTNEITGSKYGTEHIVRKTITSANLTKGTGGGPSVGEIKKFVAVPNPVLDCGTASKITWETVNFKACKLQGKDSLSSVTSNLLNSTLQVAVQANTTDKTVSYSVNLTCINTDDTIVSKDLQIDVLPCVPGAKTKHNLTVTVGSKDALANDKSLALPVVVEKKGGVVYAPIASIIRSFGGTVDWLKEKSRIDINFNTYKTMSFIGFEEINIKEGNKDSRKENHPSPYLLSGSSMVPIKAYSDIFGINLTIKDNDSVPKDEDTNSWGKKCEASKEQCTAKFSLSPQIVLNYSGGEIVSSSDLRFGVKLEGKDCNLDTPGFQKTFARIKIDTKIIQDITIPHSSKAREITVKNLWGELSPQTKLNIIDTLKAKDKDGSNIDGAKISIILETWSTFNEKKAKELALQGKKKESDALNCNWAAVYKPTDFIKSTANSGKGGNDGKIDPNDSSAIAKCKKVCKDNFDKLPEVDMIDAYGGNSKGEAYKNCEAKCEGKTLPFPGDKSKNKFPKETKRDVEYNYISNNIPSNENYATIKFYCSGCAQCLTFSADHNSLLTTDFNKGFVLPAANNIYKIYLPLGVQEEETWYLRFRNCINENEQTMTEKQNDSKWKIEQNSILAFRGWFKSIRVKNGSVIDLGNLEFEIAKKGLHSE